ncbi:MAG: excinuclease ABC subunit UvrC [Bacilli bacterium]|nr:excinuclease ABC subunit UvrC [Bacilli bacterium]
MLQEKLKLIPNSPGSYQMLNKDGKIIYVGKAKNLHKRVNSYFNRTHTGKTAMLVSEIHDFTYIVANSELEAFIIELNLIKKYDPYYNILLKDDKSYPYIEYISKPYPKLKVSRYLNIKRRDKKLIFGPYPNAYAARRIVNLLNRLYPLKKCDGMPPKPCLYFHINECLGYCTKNYNQEEATKMETEILSFLRGNDKILIDKINEKMQIHSDNLNFELAQELKEELNYIKIVLAKQKVELHDYVNRDVIGFYYDKGFISIDVFFIRNGKLLGNTNKLFPLVGEVKEDLELFIMDFYDNKEIPREIIVDEEVDKELLGEMLNTKIITPQKGKKKDLLKMANMNAKINLENQMILYLKEMEKTSKPNDELKELLKLDKLNRIDAFDNSNLFGSFSVSAMVVFKHGKPCKKEYRKYKISLEKNDDFNTMKEVIYRRYYRALIDKTEMPDLIIVDGGINQINACKSVLEDLNLNIKVCGLKKDNHHRTSNLVDGDTYQVIEVDRNKELFHYLTRIQDEVHRFTITYHKNIRSKGSISSILDNISGIGDMRKKALIKAFGSVQKIKNASVEELSKIVPEQIAINIQKFFENYQK